VEYEVQFSPRAGENLNRLKKRSPKAFKMVMKKIEWLAANVEVIIHKPIKGSPFFSLHCGPFRIPYLVDVEKRVIWIEDVAQHDLAYERINRLRL